jgi:hypothetical protein
MYYVPLLITSQTGMTLQQPVKFRVFLCGSWLKNGLLATAECTSPDTIIAISDFEAKK